VLTNVINVFFLNFTTLYYHLSVCWIVSLPYPVVCKRFFSRCVRCFNCLPQAVVAAETVAEFKRKLSNVDLSSF